MADIEMPQLGETVTEGTITQWFKQVGDQIAEDEVLFEVSTDKVDSEVPSPVAGYVTEILIPEGETVDVGTRLAVVSAEPAGGPAGGTDAAAPEPQAAPADQAEAVPAEGEADAADGAPSAPAPTEAAEPAPPSKPETELETETETDLQAPTESSPASATSPPAQQSEGVLLSPLVRRLVNEKGLDPAEIEGTGAGGRITRADVERHLQRTSGERPEEPAARSTKRATPSPSGPHGPVRPPTDEQAAPAAPAAATPAKAGGGDTVERFNNIRRRTAEHMVRSKATSPHAYITMEVDYEAVERARRAHKERFRAEHGSSLTFLPFIARALIDAIEDFPHVNASVGDGELIVHGEVHLGIAVDLNYEGLIVPVIHHAGDKRLQALARDLAELAERARTKKLSADDITGGTITITNVGASGNMLLLPIINQPQVMILSTEAVTRRPVVVTDQAGGESIAIHSVGNLTLGWDHRAFDGAYAAAFLGQVREILQDRDWEAEM